jgi:hypothetical protein
MDHGVRGGDSLGRYESTDWRVLPVVTVLLVSVVEEIGTACSGQFVLTLAVLNEM